MNPNIDTTDFTEKQKLIFLTTSVKSMAKIIKNLSGEVEELREENDVLEKKLAKASLARDKFQKRSKEYRKLNRKLNDKLRKV